jgi:hypothetical protein
MAKSDVIKAIAVTAEMVGKTFSGAAAAMMADKLSKYPESAVLKALDRCCDELKGNLTMNDVVSRIDDGRPGVEVAWSMMPRSEDVSVVMTEEMAAAWGVAYPLLKDGDPIAARMAFKEAYPKFVADAKAAGKPPKWFASLGDDKSGRESVLVAAMEKGLLSPAHVKAILPYHEITQPMQQLMDRVELRLVGKA